MSDERHLFRHGHQPTDWSQFSLEDIWTMLDSETGELSWAQHDAWRWMTELCNDQAAELRRAMAQLAEFWPPVPGSAAAAFATVVSDFVHSMEQSATEATSTGRAVAEITTTLGRARAAVELLMDQAHDYHVAEQAPPPLPDAALPGLIHAPNTMPAVAPPPPDWRAQLTTRARTIMADTDEQVSSSATGIWVGDRLPNTDLSQPTNQNPSTSTPVMGAARGSGEMTHWRNASRLPAAPVLNAGNPPPVGPPSAQAPWPVHSGAAVTPVLTSVRGFTPSGPPSLTGPQIPIAGSAQSPTGSASVGASDSGPHPVAIAGQAEPGRTIVPPPSAGGARTPSGGGRSAIRPGGRAALWGSQRRRKAEDRTDPWSVAPGVPPVLEPAPATDHQPGPGVLGLDQ